MGQICCFLQDITKLFKQEDGFIKTRWECTKNVTLWRAGVTTIANGNAKMRYACTVELHVTANNTTVLCRAEMLLWRIYVAGNNKECLGLHEKCPLFLPEFDLIWSFSADFRKNPH
jgi:hypothetical protein